MRMTSLFLYWSTRTPPFSVRRPDEVSRGLLFGLGRGRDDLVREGRRTIPPPTMVNFNSAEREVCVVRKDRTNTPLQALTQMNNVTFVEASRFLAERMMRYSDDDAAAIEFGFRQLVARAPDSTESALMQDAYRSFLDQFRGNEPAALKLLTVGEKPRDETLDPIKHAALTLTASLMMNLDEAITKE